MKKNENIITMGSSIIDFYMEGYDEGKNDDVQTVKPNVNGKKNKSTKARASSRRKKAYFKAVKRMAQLNDVAHYVPDDECKAVVHGMLRSHQLPISDCVLTCGCSIGNKKRQDTADQRLSEYMVDVQDDEAVTV